VSEPSADGSRGPGGPFRALSGFHAGGPRRSPFGSRCQERCSNGDVPGGTVEPGGTPRDSIFSSKRVSSRPVVERALDELRIDGEFDEETTEEHPTIVSLVRDVLDHGEVHAQWADSEHKVEIRQGTTTFDFDGEIVAIDDGITEHQFAMARIVTWEKPTNLYGIGDQ